ncbi:MAG: CinA family nicotinamide mononucleotide deamidase-related protein [Thermomicrobium sp.]|nr:CinA family nicotinamide mononucleotide deamidase-related protein [Thermomicrobium sp.]
MNAVVLSIGTELVDGHLTDTNATFLAQELAALGIRVAWIAQVGDDLPSIVRLLRRAREDASLVVTTGGIGPTEDDLTREAIAALLEEPLTIDPELAERIRAFFAARGLVMPERNLKQAARIPSSEPLPNPIGTAPGWFVQREDVLIVSMPGVPREMTRMWREQVIPRLLPRLGGGVIRFRTVRTIGLGESLVEERLHDLIRRGSPRIATYAKDDGVHVRITVQASDEATATRLLEETEDEVRRRLGRHVYGTDETTFGAAILEPLATAGWSLAVVEQGNGGRFTALLAEEPAAASLVRHCAVLAAMPDPAEPLAERAHRLAREAQAAAGATCGAAIVVRIAPTEAADRSPGEAVFVLRTPDGAVERRHELATHPQEFRRRATLWAAEFLLLALRETVAGAPGSNATSA